MQRFKREIRFIGEEEFGKLSLGYKAIYNRVKAKSTNTDWI